MHNNNSNSSSKFYYTTLVVTKCRPKPIITMDLTEKIGDEVTAIYALRLFRNDNDFVDGRIRITLLQYQDTGSCKVIDTIYLTRDKDIQEQLNHHISCSMLEAEVIEKLIDLYHAAELEMGV